MPHKGKVSPEAKADAVRAYLSGERIKSQILNEIGIHKSTFQDWLALYKNRGVAGLCPTSRQKVYSSEIKKAVIREYYEQGISIAGLCEKYDVSNTYIVRCWLKKYNNHVEFKDRNDGGSTYMVKGRKTSLEERIEITQSCISNGKNYNQTSDEYQISYQQIYGWVRKYEEFGALGLEDHRGKTRPQSAQTEEDGLRAEIKRLSSKLKQAEMENELLKKADEIERRRR